MTIPDRIYLQLYGDQDPPPKEWATEYGEVTWSANRVYKHDIEYVRADELRVMRRALEIADMTMKDRNILWSVDEMIEQARQELESEADS